ncbi:MAG: hypothetical protein AAF404_22885, partial [Pseudomonadota bacterium]
GKSTITTNTGTDGQSPASVSVTSNHGDLLLSDATITSETSAGGTAGVITVETLLGSTLLTQGSAISSSTEGSGKANTVLIKSPVVSVTELSEIKSETAGAGAAGEVMIDNANIQPATNETSRGTVALSSGGQITSSSTGTGAAGSVRIVNSETITLTGHTVEDDVNQTRIAIQSLEDTLLTDAAGTVSITDGGSLLLTEGAQIDATTKGAATGGEVLIDVETVQLDNSEISSTTSALNDTETNLIAGAAGSIRITTSGDTTLDNGSSVATSTSGDGAGGNIELNTDSEVTIVNLSEVSSSSTGTGQPGSITVRADALTIDSEYTAPEEESADTTTALLLNDDAESDIPEVRTGIFTESSGPGPDKEGGAINIYVNGLTQVLDEGKISAGAQQPNNQSGSIFIESDRVLLDGGDSWLRELEEARMHAEETGEPFVKPDGPQISASSE